MESFWRSDLPLLFYISGEVFLERYGHDQRLCLRMFRVTGAGSITINKQRPAFMGSEANSEVDTGLGNECCVLQGHRGRCSRLATTVLPQDG